VEFRDVFYPLSCRRSEQEDDPALKRRRMGRMAGWKGNSISILHR
jgi:hypothetical protein